MHKIEVHFCSPNHPQSNGPIERLHSTLTEHIRLLNNQGQSETPISQKMKYAILAYNYSIHSTTKFKPIDIVNGHIEREDPFNINLNQTLMSNYVTEHRDKAKILYVKINELLVRNKEKVIGKRNEDRDKPDIFKSQGKVYVKNPTRQKLGDSFKPPTQIKEVNPERKIVTSIDQKKIHMDNLKRPFRNRYSFNSEK